MPPKLAAILKVESGVNDRVAIVVTLTALEVIMGAPTTGDILRLAVLQPAVGLLIGAGIGLLGALVLRHDPRAG